MAKTPQANRVPFLIQLIEAAEQHAHGLGCHITAHALNRAKNAAGWEAAGDLDMAAKAGKGERPDV